MKKELIVANDVNIYEEFDNYKIIKFDTVFFDTVFDEHFVALHNVDVAILIHEFCQKFGLTVGMQCEECNKFHSLEELLESGAFDEIGNSDEQ